MKIIITERQYQILEMDSSVKRRIHIIERVLDKLMESMYVCDFDSVNHFMYGVLNDAGIYFDEDDNLQGMDKGDFLELLETYFEDEIHNYFLERCSDDNQLTEGENKPTNPELWSRAKAAAKSKFKVYPSAYANGFAAKWYKKRGGGWRKNKKSTNEASSPAQQAAIAINMKKKGIEPKNENVNEDLRRWFKEKWVDVSKKVDGKHPPCGRKDADGKSYPKCRPSKKVSSETPKIASSYDKEDKKKMTQQKRRAEKKDPKVGTGNKPTMTSYKKK